MAGPLQPLTPADRLAPILPQVLAAPYIRGGQDPAGWDCWGCTRWALKTLADLAPPEEIAPPIEAGLAAVARAFARAQRRWLAVAPCAGVLVLFGRRGVGAHCGFLVTERLCLHAGSAFGTVLTDIDHAYLPPLIGAWLPPEI
jgi:cell wall-associated NlpC family hydrolase